MCTHEFKTLDEFMKATERLPHVPHEEAYWGQQHEFLMRNCTRCKSSLSFKLVPSVFE